MRFGRRRDRRGRQRLRWRAGVVGQPQPSAPGRKRTRSGDDIYTWAATHAPGRQCLRPCNDGCRVGGVFFHEHPKLQHSGDDVYVRVTMSAPMRRQLPHGRGVFYKHPKLQRSGDNACVRATMSALARQRLDPIFLTLAFFRALAIQTKFFLYLFLKITQIVL